MKLPSRSFVYKDTKTKSDSNEKEVPQTEEKPQKLRAPIPKVR